MDIKIVEEAKRPLAMHPQKFALWLFMATVIMLFGGWTSAYIVKRGDTGWAEVILPSMFYYSTGIMLISSIPMILAVRAARRDNLERVKIMVSITTILGVAFLVGQIMAFDQMVGLKEFFTGGNVSHSFIYVLAGAHGLHVVSGVIVLLILLGSVFRYKVHSKNMASIEMCSMYWHFLGGLWLYLFVFLILNR